MWQSRKCYTSMTVLGSGLADLGHIKFWFLDRCSDFLGLDKWCCHFSFLQHVSASTNFQKNDGIHCKIHIWLLKSCCCLSIVFQISKQHFCHHAYKAFGSLLQSFRHQEIAKTCQFALWDSWDEVHAIEYYIENQFCKAYMRRRLRTLNHQSAPSASVLHLCCIVSIVYQQSEQQSHHLIRCSSLLSFCSTLSSAVVA